MDPDVAAIKAAVAAGNSAAVLALFEQQKKELRKRETEFRILADNTPDGIIRLERVYTICSVMMLREKRNGRTRCAVPESRYGSRMSETEG